VGHSSERHRVARGPDAWERLDGQVTALVAAVDRLSESLAGTSASDVAASVIAELESAVAGLEQEVCGGLYRPHGADGEAETIERVRTRFAEALDREQDSYACMMRAQEGLLGRIGEAISALESRRLLEPPDSDGPGAPGSPGSTGTADEVAVGKRVERAIASLEATVRALAGATQPVARAPLPHGPEPPRPPAPLPRRPEQPAPAAAPLTLPTSEELARGERSRQGSYAEGTARKLEVLRFLLEMREPLLAPELDPFAPLGHAHREVDGILGVGSGEGLTALEDLADLGLLERELFNRIHVCPKCRRCQINFRESCPRCDSIDLRVEALFHHFPCAYTGLESEFTSGIDLVCPKCRRRLYQRGQDFDQPHETYVCGACSSFFEEPELSGQCLSCANLFSGPAVEIAHVYRYRPTLLSVRAVDQKRLTGLDVSQVLFDADVSLVTRDMFILIFRRELQRLRRYGSSFSTVALAFLLDGQPYPIFREWAVEHLRLLGQILTSSLREIDVVARLDKSQLGLLLVETDAYGTAHVRKRVMGRLQGLAISTRGGKPLEPSWRQYVWDHAGAREEELEPFLDPETGA